MKADEGAGMGALLGVARGSDEPAKLIGLRYTGDEADSDVIAIVGKGITFDQGASRSSGEGMEKMKYDMSERRLRLRQCGRSRNSSKGEVIGVMPTTENMPSGARISRATCCARMSGKTIEVINTDAKAA